MTSSDRVTFNLTGTNFEVSTATFQQLRELSDKSKMLIEEAQKTQGFHAEIFLERDPACFAALLRLCRQGELHLPSSVCPQVFKAYFVVFLAVLSLSLFSMIVSTHPTFLRDMDESEWKEALGGDFHKHSAFLGKRFGFKAGVPPSSQHQISKRSVHQHATHVLQNPQVPLEKQKGPESSYIGDWGSRSQKGPASRQDVVGDAEGAGNRPGLEVHVEEWGAGEESRVFSGSEESVVDEGSGKRGLVDSHSPRSGVFVTDGMTTPSKKVVDDAMDPSGLYPRPSINEVVNNNQGTLEGKQEAAGVHPDKILTVNDERKTTIRDKHQHDKQLMEILINDADVLKKLTTPYLEDDRPRSDQIKQIGEDIPRVKRAAPRPNSQTTQTNTITTEPTSGETFPQTNATNSTEPKAESSQEHNGDAFEGFENYQARRDFLVYIDYMCLVFFTVDFVLRMLFCPRLLSFCRNVLNVCDFIALLAGYVMVLVNVLMPEEKYAKSHLDLIECLQIFRFVRFFRPLRDVIGFKVLVHSVKASTYELLLLVMFLSSGCVVFSTLVYWCERDNMVSIPDAFWWAIVTMTTVGYGDVTPISFLGKVVGSLCALSGVVLIAITIPVLVNNFLLFYGFAKVISARHKEAKEQEMKDKWQHTARGMLGRPGSGVTRVHVHPISEPQKDALALETAKVKVDPPSFKEKRSPPQEEM
ncbi:uncharacterized protein LOC143287154 [Babylonia areolata]|uniref:uncharacterized protein LOC143287154 n=1 Tax=Babylonia areolata TaxID=304850 RepID=UPI003FD617AB